jgi:hypothetical protein
MFTYAVEPARLARCLPDGIVVDERAGTGLVSAVPFLDRDFRFRALPFAKVSCARTSLGSGIGSMLPPDRRAPPARARPTNR